MNFIFVFFVSAGIVSAMISGTENEIFTIITQSLSDTGGFIINLMMLTGFFSGIMEICKSSGILSKLCKIIEKTFGKVFKTKNETAKSNIFLNIAANMIGIGNAATPAGLMAMKSLDTDNNQNKYPSYDMCKFMLFNTCSVQLIPTTVISLRSIAGSHSPTSVFFPVIIVSCVSLIFGLTVLKFIYRRNKFDKDI